MPLERLARFALLPELKFIRLYESLESGIFDAEKASEFEVCPKCAKLCYGIYDRRWVTVKDAPIRGRKIVLRIRKRRFWCSACKKPFTEPVPGISKGHRTTARFQRELRWACDTFESLKKAQRHMGCSTSTLYRLYYKQLELDLRKRQYPWPRSIGVDEHKYAKNREKRYPEFATIFVDHKNRRVFELAKGRDFHEVKRQIERIPGRENVKVATLDLSQPYRRLITEMFPNAELVADKFHVVRLLHPAINRRRKEITGDKRKLPIRKLLLRNGKDLDYFTKTAIYRWLEDYPELKEIYMAKEAIHGLYRVRGHKRAERALQKMLDRFGHSKVKEVQTLRRTLLRWRKEILNYFKHRATNGRTEAFNGKAKLVRKKGYGFRSFENYRMRLLTCCT